MIHLNVFQPGPGEFMNMDGPVNNFMNSGFSNNDGKYI